MRDVQVTAVVVHRDQPERLRVTVDALRAQGLADDSIVVVDNASSSPVVGLGGGGGGGGGLRVIEAGANLGFGGGANAGIRATSSGDWVLVLPHDARPSPGCLDAMLDAVAQRPRAGLACAEYGDDEVPIVDPFLGALTVPGVRRAGGGWEPAGFAHGTFLLVRRACLDEIGLFDESYFAYCEEADLSLRARRAGWEVGMVWGARVDNPHQGTPPAVVDYLMVRNTLLLVRRHFGRYRWCVRLAVEVVALAAGVLRPDGRSPWFSARARVLALRDALAGRIGMPPAALFD